MIVVHDYTQLIKISQRRLTATWHERRGTRVDIVPQIAREAATGVDPWALAEDAERWERRLRHPPNDWPEDQRMEMRVALWWVNEWLRPEPLYKLHVPTVDQARKAVELRRAIGRHCFTCHPSEVERNSDTIAVCEALAIGAHLLVTRNMGTIRVPVLNAWVSNYGQAYGFASDTLVEHSDRWLLRELNELRTDEDRTELAKTTIGAFWPHEHDAPALEVLDAALQGAQRMRFSPFSETMLAAEGILLEASEGEGARALQWIEELRETLPEKTRGAERRHPRYPHRDRGAYR